MSEFSLGKILQLLQKASEQGVAIAYTNNELSVNFQKGRQIDKSFLDELRQNKAHLIQYFQNFTGDKAADDELVVRKIDRSSNTPIPISFSQERLWFIHQLQGSTQYHLATVIRLKGDVNKAVLQNALQGIINRHEVLRTVINESDGKGYQIIKKKDNWRLQIVTTDDYPANDEGLQLFINQFISRPFDLERDDMLRAALIDVAQGEYLLVVTMHHIASDAWSEAILVREVLELYSAGIEGREANLPALPIQYADYAAWQRENLQGEALNKKVEYWQNKLADVSPLQMPTDFIRPVVQSRRGDKITFNIDKALAEEIKALSQKQGTTLFITLLTLYKILLYRYSGQGDITVGTSIASRQQKDLEGLIGFFVNTLALRDEVDGEASFTDLLQQVKATALGAYEHQDIPFEKVVEVAARDRDAGRSPLFQVMLVLANTPQASKFTLHNLEFSYEAYQEDTTKFEITFFINETPDGLQGSVQYSTDLYSAATIQGMISHFKVLMASAVANPQQKVALLPMLSETEEEQLTSGINQNKTDYPKDKTIVELFEQQAAKTPQATAVVFEDSTLTYQQLNEAANQLAHHLQNKGIQPGTLVPLYMHRGAGMITGILGILKAGCAYVPVDTDFPAERIRYMLSDTTAKYVVADTSTQNNLPPTVQAITLDDASEQPTTNNQQQSTPAATAYVIYTSGSTGNPKGVLVSHRNLVDYYVGLDEAISISDCKSFALVSTIATDLGNTVLYASLLSGGALHVFTKEAVSNIEYLHSYFANNNVECVKIVPSHWKALTNGNSFLLPKKLIVFGGEALQAEDVMAIAQQNETCRVVNHYGPTETTIGKLCHEVQFSHKYNKTIPIGKPFGNTSVYVLTKNLQVCPVGVAGQLYISGDGVAQGYLNNEELTKEKFTDNPFAPDTKMYGTGDLVKWLSDGNIEFIGRADDQVKIRGYRVELGEIESILQQSGLVKQAVVLARAAQQGNKRLVGYVVPSGYFDREEVMEYLQQKLPEYMIPQVLVNMEEMPMMANGKIDRKALPDPDVAELLSEKYVAPRNDTEAQLAAIWSDVLEVDEVGMNDDFFELGGHSLLAVRLVSAIRKAFGVEMPIGDIFDYPTVGLLAEQLSNNNQKEVLPPVTPITEKPQQIPLSFSQERLWFIDRLGGSLQYHIPSVLRLTGNLNIDALQHAIQQVVKRHEVLRTIINDEAGTGYQQVQSWEGWKLEVIEDELYNEDAQAVQQYIKQNIEQPFDLGKDYMLRATLVKLEDQQHILVATLHHIASDGWSTSIMVKELAELYNSFTQNKEAQLPQLPVQYADYALWQRTYLQGEAWDKKLDYWKQKLSDTAALQIPTDYKRPPVQSTRGAVSGFRLSKEVSDGLNNLSQKHGATLFMTLLAAFKVLMYRYSGQSDICVGTPIAGRQQSELEGLIGFFVNTLALRTQVNGSDSFEQLLAQVRTTTLEAYDHQEVPFEKVVELTVKDRDMSRSPLFQVMFVLQNTPEVEALKLGDLQLSPAGRNIDTHVTSKFDLTFTFEEQPDGLSVSVEYCTDLYSEETIKQFSAHFDTLLHGIVAAPQKSIGTLPMLTQQEIDELLIDYNKSSISFDNNKETIVSLFENLAEQQPTATALIFENERISYAELNEQANRIAHFLLAKGIQKETIVAVCMHRSAQLVTTLLGIMKSGAAYLPIDPGYAVERMNYMVQDAGAVMLLTDNKFKTENLHNGQIELINIEELGEALQAQATYNIAVSIQEDQLAYVIYTSGSTGRPKGVMIEHKGVTNLIYWYDGVYRINKQSKATAMAGVGFDAFGWEVWPILGCGASLLILTDEVRNNVNDILDYVIKEQITHCFLATALVPDFLEASKGVKTALRFVQTGGDKLGAVDTSELDYTLVNNYGPTENTVVASYYSLPRKIQPAPPIGRTVTNTILYLVNDQGELVPKGAAGELCMGGRSLARGYMNLPGLTAEKFIKDRYGKAEGGRVYLSGDICRWLPDGNLEYLGRKDEQVKIRGFRIELGEVENIVLQSGLVQTVIVLAKEDKKVNKQLVGYVVPQHDYSREKLLSYLKSHIPAFMIPLLWKELEQVPFTANGKVDKRALPDVEAGELASAEYVAPRTETEEKLALIWQGLLGVERVGINDNFFELGGHSLMAMRMVSMIRKEMDTEVAIMNVFTFPTIATLVSFIDDQQKASSLPPVKAAVRPQHIPLSFSQERLWFIDQLEGSLQYHIPMVLRLKGDLSIEALSGALQQTVKRHEVLRTTIHEHAGTGYQVVKNWEEWQLQVIDGSVYKDDKAGLSQYIKACIEEPFDLANDFKLRASLLTINDNESILVATFHHIAADGWSVELMARETEELYTALLEERQPRLPKLEVQYGDFAIWQRDHLQQTLLDQKLQYWKHKLQDVTPLQFPLDYVRPAVQSTRGNVKRFSVDGDTLDKIQQASTADGATLFMSLLTVFKILLYRYTGQADICVGTPIAGRQHKEVEALIGFFVNTLALRDEIRHDDTYSSLLSLVKQTTVEAYEHQEVPFEKVVEAVQDERDMSKSPLFQVLFVLQNTPGKAELNLPGVETSGELWNNATSKFDFSFYLVETSTGLNGFVEYCTDLFDEQTIERLISHYKQLLFAVTAKPAEKIGLLPMLTRVEQQQLLYDFNQTKTSTVPATITELFSKQAAATPGAIALQFQDEQLTYEELNTAANQLAHYLVVKGVTPGSLVPVCIERSSAMIVSILAVLKAGAAFVPVDPAYPSDRIAYMLDDVNASIIITSGESHDKIKNTENLATVLVDLDWPVISMQPKDEPAIIADPHSLAYVIHTSGSTGLPKGVMIEHHSVVNLLLSVTSLVNFNAGSAFLSVTTFSFDICYLEFFVPLINGGRLIVVPREVAIDGYELAGAIAKYHATHLQATPVTWQLLLDAGWRNNEHITMLIGGEAVKEEIKNALTPLGEVYNMYGPTETTIWSVATQLHRDKKVLIGRPLANTDVYILDKEQQLVPVGVAGEICIGGAGLAKGYLHRPELTNEKFIPNPLTGVEGDLLYKTGDLGKWMPDGSLECLGRIDEQVKIRGYRIEPGEIETVLMSGDLVSQAVVIAQNDIFNNKKLVAYYIPLWEQVRQKENELYKQRVESWKEIYNTEYTTGTPPANAEFDIGIWNDSLTGTPIAESQMRDWVQDIVKEIMTKNPGNVLEIGCGTGLIYYPLAGKVDKYTGTDFSAASINGIRKHIEQGSRNFGPTDLQVCAAHEISLLNNEHADTIILNSIVQYFPGEGYMDEVMERCLSLISDNGRIIIGDVRDNRLLELFKMRLQLQHMAQTAPVKEFLWSVQQEVLKEEELCFSPTYFYALQERYPQISHIEIKWKNTDNTNELTLYRYTVIIHVGQQVDVLHPSWINFEEISVDGLRHQVEAGDDIIAVAGVPNFRLWQESALSNVIEARSALTVEELKQAIDLEDEASRRLNELYHLAKTKGYGVRLLVNDDPLKINMVMEREPSGKAVSNINQDTTASTVYPHTNVPLFDDISVLLQKDLRELISRRLPEYMIPAEMIAISQLPLTNNGKVDRKFLSLRQEKASVSKLNYQEPRTATEKALTKIWQELLGVGKIGVHDNFFELGGHSLMAMRLVSAIRKELQFEISIKALFNHATIESLAAHLDGNSQASSMPAIEKQERPALIPLSFSQERLWFIDKLEGSIQYHLTAILRLKGKLDQQAFEKAFYNLITRHEVLRTVFIEVDDKPYQLINPADDWKLNVVSSNFETKQHLQEHVEQLARKPFNLSRDYMIRASLVNVGEDEKIMVVTVHHIAADGWSTSILIKELLHNYATLAEGNDAALKPLDIQYADYAIWQRKLLQGRALNDMLQYWQHQLHDVPPLQLPTDFQRPPLAGKRGALTSFRLSKQLTEQLHALSRQQGTTLFMTMLSAFNVLMQRYSGQADICVGTPVTNRNRREVEDLVGFFINTLAIRTQLGGDPVFTQLLQQVKTSMLDAYAHMEVPFEKVVEVAGVERHLSRNPIFQVLFSMQNNPAAPAIQINGLSITPEEFEHKTSQLDIICNLTETADGMEGLVEYSTDLFRQNTIDRMMIHFRQLLISAVAAPQSSISKLQMLSAVEQRQLLQVSRGEVAALKPVTTITALFEQQVQQTPSATALVYKNVELTFEELNARVNQLAHVLLAKGVKPGVLVAVCLDRSIEMMVAVLGILKAGGAYVPVDPEYPEDRVNFILGDSKASVIVSSSEHTNRFGFNDAFVVELDAELSALKDQPVSIIKADISLDDLAYVIYTSGSTGRPKGVMVQHSAIINYLVNSKTNYVGKQQRGAGSFVHLSYTFDASLTAMFMPLINGRTVVISSKNSLEVFDDENLAEYAPYDFIKITPAHLGLLQLKMQEGKTGLLTKKIVIGGEALFMSQVQQFAQDLPEVEIINEYGPTEASVGCSVYSVFTKHLNTAQQGGVSIGKPIDNTSIYILGPDDELLPVGAAGEVAIGGAGLAKGYVNNESLTSQKFVTDPFATATGSKMYKTGDIARRMADGNIEYIGRKDDQVKIRGYRIELGEVEAALQESELVKQAVVLAKEDSTGGKRLVGYVVPAEDFDKEELLQELKAKLPDYMIPSVLMEIESMPLTVNGKIDKRALPDPSSAGGLVTEDTLPASPAETLLTEIWKDVLELDEVGINDDFFDLGGHSLLAIRLISLIRKQFKVEMQISEIFNYPTIRLLANHLQKEYGKEEKASTLPSIEVSQRPDQIPLSFSQERLWFIDQMEGSVQYHVPAVLRIKGGLNTEALAFALRQIVNRHQVLRTVVRQKEGQGFQHINPPDSWQLGEENFTARDGQALQAHIRKLISKPFDLQHDHMLRADLLKVAPNEHILVFTIHHIASDGWSASILVKELIELYRSYTEDKPANLPPLPVQYADFAIWQRNYLYGDVLENKLAFWKDYLNGVQPLQLPTDHLRPAVQSTKGASVSFVIDKNVAKELNNLSRQQNASIFITLLAAFNAMLFRYTGQTDICVGTPIAGRQQPELEGLIGFFLNTLALRNEVSGKMPFTELLRQVRANTLKAYEHQDVPFEKIVEAVVSDREVSHNPLFQVMFILQNTPKVDEPRVGGIELQYEPLVHDTTKFDLTFGLSETEDGFSGIVEYSPELFEENTVNAMVAHFKNLLAAITQAPEQPVGQLSMLTKAERQQLTTDFNDTDVPFPQEKSIAQMFEEQVLRTPDRSAVGFEGQALTYTQLNERSNGLAHYLRSKGVQTNTLVPIYIQRSFDMIVGVLAILKAGGAYVPIDTDYPEKRVAHIINEIEPALVLTSQADRVMLSGLGDFNIVAIDEESELLNQQPADNPQSFYEPNDLAYLLYTSGSTGIPKGVKMPGKALVNLLHWQEKQFTNKHRHVLQFASLNFDVSFQEIFSTLCFGGTLFLINADRRKDAAELLGDIVANKISHLFIPYIVLKNLADSVNAVADYPFSLEEVIVAGEQLKLTPDIRSLLGTKIGRIVNQYGPTEAHVVSSYTIDPQGDLPLLPPIGKPIDNVKLYILDEENQLVPVGVPGQLYIGGVQVAEGYQKQPRLTSEKFVKNMVADDGYEVLYKTGDVARWLRDGNIEYLGRADDQVKIRGYRVEIGEIETVLQQCNLVKEAVVVATEDEMGGKRLVGYIVPSGEYKQEEITGFLQERLPAFMVPLVWVQMNELTVNSNGKVNRRALPNPDLSRFNHANYVTPVTEQEIAIAGIWQNLLGIERVGVHDNFFELGGHSLLAMRVVAMIRKQLDVELSLNVFFKLATVQKLANYVKVNSIDNSVPLEDYDEIKI